MYTFDNSNSNLVIGVFGVKIWLCELSVSENSTISVYVVPSILYQVADKDSFD